MSSPRPVDFPLRLRALARKDPSAAARALGLDRDLQAVARRAGEAGNERARKKLLDQMIELRVQLDALVATTLGKPLPNGVEASALDAVPAQVREQLGKLLGVPLRPEFYPVLEKKAEEWIEQGRAFDEIASEFGFVEARALGPIEPRGALVLTYNGSLVQMSLPKDPEGTRRFIYQSIYVNSIPSEGSFKLKDAVLIDGRMRTTAMDTSTVRKLRVATRQGVPWERERRTFDRLSTVLTPAPPLLQSVGRKTGWGVLSSFLPNLGSSQLEPGRPSLDAERAAERAAEQARLEEAKRAARVELGGLLDRLASATGHRATLDVEVLGLCMHLQTLEVDRGRKAYELGEVESCRTDRDERLTFEHGAVRLDRPGRGSRTFPLAALADQQIVVGAPLLLLDDTGSVMTVLGDVSTITAIAMR